VHVVLWPRAGRGWYADTVPPPHDETHPLRMPTDDPRDASLRGAIELERLVTGTPELEGVVLRYAFFYGPHTSYTADNAPEPHVSIDGAARATLLAVEGGPAGIYNIADDGQGISTDRARDLLGWRP
jgi:nucleoside-diphosphate-sugar epimerase